MASDAADASAAAGSCACEVDVGIVRFRAPEFLGRSSRIFVEEGEIKVAMEDVSPRKGEVLLQIQW